MRLIDADDLLDHVGRVKLDSREAVMQLINNMPSIHAEINLTLDNVTQIVAREFGIPKENVRLNISEDDTVNGATISL